MQRVPLWLKVAYLAWMAVWIPAYWIHNGPANFLWFCDLANFVLGLALWIESPLLLSSQAVGVLLVQVLWVVDVLSRPVLGFHLIGGTEYMYDATKPLSIRLLSLFHAVMPALLVWGLSRLGYDRRGWKLQTAIAWLVLPVCYFATDPTRNLNWVFRPFEKDWPWAPPEAVFAACLVGYPLILYLPSHLALQAWARRRGRVLAGRATEARAAEARRPIQVRD